MMKEIVTESIADGVAPVPDAGTRVWGNLTIAPDTGSGPSITKEFAWKTLLTPWGGGVLPTLAHAAREAGTPVWFEVVEADISSVPVTYQFRTYAGQLGQDLTIATRRIVFDQGRGNFGGPFYEIDRSDEVNYVYGGGQALKADRNIQQVYDAGRYGSSQWNRCEGFADARDQETDAGVIAAAREELVEGRPMRRAGGRLKDTEGTRFGIDWDFGDKVTARYRGREFAGIVSAVTIGKQSNGDDIFDARFEWED